MIVDISDSGARVRVGQKAHLPASFYLVDTRDRLVFRTYLAWSSGQEHGLRILAKIDLERSREVCSG